MIAQPIDTAPLDRPILAYGSYAWESLDHSRPERCHFGWLVVQWNPECSYDDECQPIGAFVSITANPYKDYMIATCWCEIPNPT